MELYQLAKQLFAVKTPDQRDKWVTDFFIWTKRYEGFLAEKTLNERGRWVNAHDRLVKARNTLKTLTKSGEMFTFLEADIYRDGEVIGSLPCTNNAIEGGVNRQLRTMLGEHRGLENKPATPSYRLVVPPPHRDPAPTSTTATNHAERP